MHPLSCRAALGAVFRDNEAAWGTYNDTFEASGWDRLEVHTNPGMDDATTAAAAGASFSRVHAVLSRILSTVKRETVVLRPSVS
jgi:hypothetical protein